ncbi:MAG: DNA polymerase I [Candidatus Andersenbacteria bacterium]
MSKRQKLALIDANALIHRAYHALPPMSTSDGTPTNAVYGFTTMLLKMFATIKPTHIVAAFDVKGPTFRKEAYAKYKAHRKATPDDLVEQFALVKEVLKAFNIPMIEKQGFEADDVIGTLVEEVNGNVQKIIVTGDMDTLQLIDDDTSVFTLKRGLTDTVLYDARMVQEKFGFSPEYVVDYKGLRGDPSDNIPGVAGVGDKTARELIIQFGSIEEVYKHLDEVSPRVKSRLEGGKKEALLSKELATIRRDVPIQFSLADAEAEDFNPEAVRDVFVKMNFNSLLNRLPSGASSIQPTLFTNNSNALATNANLPEHYYLVQSAKGKKDLQVLLRKQTLIAFDTETDQLGPRQHPILGMSFAIRDDKKNITAWYVPVTPAELEEWRDILESPKIKKTGHNLKYDYEVLLQTGILMEGIEFDSMIAAYLLNPGARQFGMDALAIQELSYHPIPLTDLIGSGAQQKRLSEVSVPELARYACEDADISLQLYETFAPRIEKEGLKRVFVELELPLIPILARIENNGISVDTTILSKLNIKVTHRLQQLEKSIWKEAGEEFNINSTQQLRVILFERLQLPTDDIKRTQTGYSTAASELEKLHGKHPIIILLEEYRELSKLKNTYIDTLPTLVDPETSRIYASFNQTVAATGRLSSSDPNLQNIPVRTEMGQEIRKAFVAEKGNVLVKADYSQIELRLAAHMSRDEKMMGVFRAGKDIHSATAAWVYGIDIDSVTSSQRREAKTLNFGVLYGMGPQSFARAAGISVEEARSFIGRYRKQYAGLAGYIEETIEFAREHEEVSTLFGRKRYLPEIHSRAPAIAAQAERMAFNFPLQGTAADLLKKAMIELHNFIQHKYPDARMVLTVHDELVCEVSKEDAQEFAQEMKHIMEQVITLDVPIVVDVALGGNWQDVEELKL